jgi:PAS domain S-box-containing protein
MVDQRARSLTILARLQAVLGATISASIFAAYTFSSVAIADNILLLAAAVLGALCAVYYLTLHQVLGSANLSRSTLVMSLITIASFALVIISTGGLDSPYYALWPLAVVVAGIFGSVQTLVLLALSMVYFFYIFLNEGYQAPYFTDHVIQFAITLCAVALAEWIHSRSRKVGANASKIQSLSGQLSAEQLKADAIMSSIAEGVMVVDGARRIQLFNKAAQNLTGWDESSAQGIDYNLILQLHTSDDLPINSLNDPVLEAWTKKSEVVRNTLLTTTHKGRKIQLNISVSPIFDDAGQPSGAIALFRDISAEKEVERQKEEFVSTASHEMRTPVAAIEGYISLAMNQNVATIDDRARKYLEKAHETITHLGELFRDLLSVTKAEENQLGGHIEAVNVGKLVQEAVDDMQFTVKKKNLTLVYQIGNSGGKVISPLFYVAANAERLREVVMNLIENANKFTPEGGIEVVLTGNEKEVTVGVSDSGVGISREDMAHLFQKFYRIDNSATRTIGGTGLGLYLCRRLIESFNGRIWVESKPDAGSTFKFTLPRLSDAEIAKLTEAPATSGLIMPTVTSADIPNSPAEAPMPILPQPIPTIGIDTSRTPMTNPVPAVRGLKNDISRRIS